MVRLWRRGAGDAGALPSRRDLAPRAPAPTPPPPPSPTTTTETPTPTSTPTPSLTLTPGVAYKTLDDGRIVPAITRYDGSPVTEAEGVEPADMTSTEASSYASSSIYATATNSFGNSSSNSSSVDPPVMFIRGGDSGFWYSFSDGVKAAIIISIILGFVAIVIASIWFCCGRPRRRRRKERESIRLDAERERGIARQTAPGASVENLPVPLRTMRSREERESRGAPPQAQGAQRSSLRHSAGQGMGMTGTAGTLTREMSLRDGGMGMDAPPPRYEEVVPNTHQRVAGGLRQSRPEVEDEGMGVVADGKMPLSEIPFEDVVLNPPRSEASSSSSRDFGERHAQGGGDTTGHTNS